MKQRVELVPQREGISWVQITQAMKQREGICQNSWVQITQAMKEAEVTPRRGRASVRTAGYKITQAMKEAEVRASVRTAGYKITQAMKQRVGLPPQREGTIWNSWELITQAMK